MRSSIRMLVMAGMILSFTGCAHVFRVSVDAINSGPGAGGQTYVIVPGNQGTPAHDLQFKEFAGYLHRALQDRGYRPAEEGRAPELEIYLSYGIGEPQPRVRYYTVPIWGQTGTSITTQEATHIAKDGSTNTSTRTEVIPEYGVTGWGTVQKNYMVYPRFVEVDAYQVIKPEAGARLEEVWRTTIRSEGKHSDLRRVFPIMLAAASAYLGGNTQHEIVVNLTKNDRQVLRLKGLEPQGGAGH